LNPPRKKIPGYATAGRDRIHRNSHTKGTIAFVHHNKFLTEFHIIKHPTEFGKLLILPTAIFVIITMLEQSDARHLLNIPFPDDTVSKRV
jgi:hypothetical protein